MAKKKILIKKMRKRKVLNRQMLIKNKYYYININFYNKKFIYH